MSTKKSKSVPKQIQAQLEFYLSESNLRNDKFLQKQADSLQNFFIDLDVFLTFGKMIALKATRNMIVEAAEKSKKICIDPSKTRIGPVESPFVKDDTSLDRTIYIDKFYRDHDHDSLRKLLSQFGKVTLVSLPRFDSTRHFKGFGFVEFENPEAAREAMRAINQRHKNDQNGIESMRAMMKKLWLVLKTKMNETLINPAAILNNTTRVEGKSEKRRFEEASMELEEALELTAKVRRISPSNEECNVIDQQ
uniref:Uncharacterized protein AlNc14C121G6683 n=1 Tax=Albugo laibachii Nc14 TaxID=890382 RepID=F0WJF4_9STRA|nr:conserved hypothetical protein [Albugo laibachii Nc14]|eukprot:CCA21403.1 conserved hypothetical protein [Albugo laibachii Nc14]